MQPAKTSSGHAATPPVVFVVDDEPLLLDLAAVILKSLGCEVRTFSGPESALKAFPGALPELVITDYAMGRMNGIDLIRECRRIRPGQKTLMVSGSVDESIFANAVVKPDRFLAKPYQFSDFSNCVRELLAGK